MGRSWASALLMLGRVVAYQHHLFTSSITTPHLYALEFDDEDNALINIANISAHGGHPWLSFSYNKGSIYAGEGDGFASYTVENTTSLIYKKSIKIGNQCGPGMNGRAPPYVIAELRTPFNVFGAPVRTCGTAMSVDVDGDLDQIVQAYKYHDRSNIQGLTLDPENKFLYSADEGRDGIWTHLVTDQGTVQQVGFTQSAFTNSGPKKVVVHPNGRFLYAILSKLNTVVVYAINQGANSDRTPLTYTGVSYSLLPPGVSSSQYSTDELYLSADANVLFVTARYRVESGRSTNNPPPGFIRAILLTALSESDLPVGGRMVGAGFPIRPLFHMETRTSGGLTNAVSPAPWANEFFALADSQYGLVEIWKMDNLETVSYLGDLAQGAASAPKGGWVSGNWVAQGVVTTPDPVPVATPAPTQQAGQPFGNPSRSPKQSATPQPQPQPKPQPQPQPNPNLPWGGWQQPKQPQLPWQLPKQTQQPKPAQQPKQGGWPFNWGAQGGNQPVQGEDDDDEERRRNVEFDSDSVDAERTAKLDKRRALKSRIARVIFPNSNSRLETRQQSRPVTVSIVASWQAPSSATPSGRLWTQDTSPASSRPISHGQVKVKPWTGSRKRSTESVEQPIAAALDGYLDAKDAEMKPQALGKECCGNAVWFD